MHWILIRYAPIKMYKTQIKIINANNVLYFSVVFKGIRYSDRNEISNCDQSRREIAKRN